MTARLFSKTGETRGLELDVELEGEAIVGRDPASDLAIERPLMSSRHARIFYDGDAGRYVLEDLDSLNGTELDGDPVTGPELLRHLHVITFAGNYDFFFQDPERCASRHPDPPTYPPTQASRPAPADDDAPATKETDEVTSVDSEPIALPDFLAWRADAIGDSAAPGAGSSPTPSEITSIEREPVALPDFLARRADEARADKAPGEEARAGSEDAETDKTGHTVREKLPVGLPDVLARRSEQAAEKVRKHETVDLADIEELIASEEVTVLGTSRLSPSEGASGTTIEGLQLIVTESGGRVRQFPLAEGENVVGRGVGVHVALKYPDLSRRHAILTVAGGGVTIRDLGSRNRTFVNDLPVDAKVDVEVRPGVRLRFGSVEARLAKVGGDG